MTTRITTIRYPYGGDVQVYTVEVFSNNRWIEFSACKNKANAEFICSILDSVTESRDTRELVQNTREQIWEALYGGTHPASSDICDSEEIQGLLRNVLNNITRIDNYFVERGIDV